MPRHRARASVRAYRDRFVRASGLDRVGARWRQLPQRARTLIPAATLLAVAITYPFYLASLPVNKGWEFWVTFPSMHSAVTIVVFTMMAVGLNVVVGYCGLLDLGYVAFYALGAYTAGWLASGQFQQVRFHFGSVGITHEARGVHISIWGVLLCAAFVTAIGGILIGLPTLRLRGDYLAIVTLGFGEIVPQFVRNADNLHGFNLTNGTFGINPIDSPGFGNRIHNAIGVPAAYTQEFNADRLFFWTVLGLLLVTIFCCIRLRDSRLGRAWIAIREDETAAGAMGIPLMRTKTWAYAIGAFFGGVAGAYIASFNQVANPSQFNFNISVFLLCMVVLGGMGSIWGVVVGAVLLSWLNVEGLANIGSWLNTNTPLKFDVAKYQFGIYGIILVLMMLFRPVGIIPERRRKREIEEGTRGALDEPLYEMRGADEPGAGERGRIAGGAERMSEEANGDLLVAAEVRKEFGGLLAINDLDFTIPQRSIVSLIGPNGAGKTTFFNTLTGLYKTTSGQILFDGRDVTDKPPHAIVKAGVGRTFQNIRLFPQMTALENVLVGMHSRLKGGILGSIIGTPRVRREEREARDKARELLSFSGLGGVDDELAESLAYGDQRRLEVARALATEPKLLLLDEPTAGMNPQETVTFMEFVSTLREHRPLAILLIEHDMKVVMGVSERVTVLDYGEKIAEGTPQEIQKDERVIEAYLGKGATG